MSVHFAVEKFSECWEDGWPLFVRHKAELASWEESPLRPNSDFYRRSSEAGMTLFVTARDNGALVGYAVYFIQPSLHYAEEIWASSDTFILMPEYRNCGLGDAMYEFAREECRNRGARVIQTSVRADHAQGRALGMLLTRHGCKRLAIMYSQRLD